MDETGKHPHCSESNASDYDSDFEGEEDETFGSGSGAQSDSGGGGGGGLQESQRRRGGGRKRQLSDAMTGDTQDLSPQETKGRQASNLHNEREKERRKDLKLAVHRLRNQLQLHQTKKATTISVLKASEQEIKDLVRQEDDQKRQLTDLETRHKHLIWKLQSLKSEPNRETSRSQTCSGSSISSPSSAPILTPVTNYPPPFSSFYIPAVEPPSPSIPPASPSLLIQPPRPIPPSTFPFGFQNPSLFPSPVLPLLTSSPHSGFSPARRPFLFVPPVSPQHFAIPSFLPRFATNPSQFSFSSAPGTPPSHLPSPSSFLLHTLSPPGPVVPQPFPVFLTPPAVSSIVTSGDHAIDEGTRTPSPPHVLSPAPPGRRWRATSLSPSHETSKHSPEILPHCSQTLTEPQPPPTTPPFSQDRQGHTRDRRYSETTTDTLIDIEALDQDVEEEDSGPFLGMRSPHRKQRKRRENDPMKPDRQENTREHTEEPPHKIVQITEQGEFSSEEEREEETRDENSNSPDHKLLFRTVKSKNHRQQKRFGMWKRRTQTSTSSMVLGLSSHLSTVICS